MPSGFRKTSGNHFEIYYEQPWGGVASDKDPVDIADNQLVKQDGVVVVDGVLSQFNLVADPVRFQWTPHVTNAVPILIFILNGQLYAVDQFGNAYLRQGTGDFVFSVAASDGPWSANQPPTAVQVVNGLAYISNYARASTYTFNGAVPYVVTPAFTLVSNYVGGGIFGVLDDYLLQMNVDQITDGPQPNRINWSAPGAFSTWDPSVNRAAGFNTLAAIEDQITGFLSYASVGVVITEKGLVELSPTGVGIEPFQFTTLWTSEVGQGCTFPNSVTQYGQRGLLCTNTGVFSATTAGGFTDISAQARKAILSSFQIAPVTVWDNGVSLAPLVTGSVFLYSYNSPYATPYYMLACAPVEEALNAGELIVWLMDLATGIWQSATFSIDALINQQHGPGHSGGVIQSLQSISLDQTAGLFFSPVSIQTQNPVTLVYGSVLYGSTLLDFILTPYIYNRDNLVESVNGPSSLSLTFKANEIKLGYTRKPTVRRAVVKAYGTGTLAVTVTDVSGNVTSLGNIVLDGSTNAKSYYTPTGTATVEDPQLHITCAAFQGVIVKVMMAGTYADGEID